MLPHKHPFTHSTVHDHNKKQHKKNNTTPHHHTNNLVTLISPQHSRQTNPKPQQQQQSSNTNNTFFPFKQHNIPTRKNKNPQPFPEPFLQDWNTMQDKRTLTRRHIRVSSRHRRRKTNSTRLEGRRQTGQYILSVHESLACPPWQMPTFG